MKEATARIKINKLLEGAGWRFFDDENGLANIQLEPNVTLKKTEIDALGENFEKTSKGFVDFVLIDEKKFPVIVLEAKAADKHPLVGKEQARDYATSLKCRFVILTNGDQHYLWDTQSGNPSVITAFPTPESIGAFGKTAPDKQKLIEERVEDDYIAHTQRPGFEDEAGWKNEEERDSFREENGLRFLREYQKRAIHKIQEAVADGKERFLLEMATGTGKTLTSAAIIKLFLRTGNARRVLFLVDRLELEDQAHKAFVKVLANDYTTVIYKEKRDEWNKADIVVTTVQSLQFDNKYQRLFSPTDFDLIISDEAHRSIGGNARAVFEYFVGYKLGLTATPRDYLNNFSKKTKTTNDPKELERRNLLDTYRTFGCNDGNPTFRYTLIDGVKDEFLINPTVVDARTDVTTKILSETGFVVSFTDDDGEDHEESYERRAFEKKFFAEGTNELFCKTFLEKAYRDPISGEIGKSIIFAVSQKHAAKLAQIFNEIADKMFPGKYQSDFAMQVTSQVNDAQQMTVNFSNNNLGGNANIIPEYRTSKARICVTVGMMTTGYDCPDLLNLGLFRPVFSPTDFIQIKGRGTRKHDFREELHDQDLKDEVGNPHKTSFKLFDFFANCEYFEDKFDYDEVLKLPVKKKPKGSDDETDTGGKPPLPIGKYTLSGKDILASINEEKIGPEGMKVDRMFFSDFGDHIRENDFIASSIEAGKWDRAIDYINYEVFDKPDEFFTLKKLRKAAGVDRRLSLREILEKIFGLIPRFKEKDELLEEEFAKFVAEYQPEEPKEIPALKTYFKAYATSVRVRTIIDEADFAKLHTNAVFSMKHFKAVPAEFRVIIPTYIRDYVPLDQFAAA